MKNEEWKECKNDIFVGIMWEKGLKTGEERYFSMEDLENGNVELPNDLRNDILQTFKELTFNDLKKLDNESIEELLNNEAFSFQCFSFHKDFEQYVKSHKCYVSKDYVFSRDGATLDAYFWFYVFL